MLTDRYPWDSWFTVLSLTYAWQSKIHTQELILEIHAFSYTVKHFIFHAYTADSIHFLILLLLSKLSLNNDTEWSWHELIACDLQLSQAPKNLRSPAEVRSKTGPCPQVLPLGSCKCLSRRTRTAHLQRLSTHLRTALITVYRKRDVRRQNFSLIVLFCAFQFCK